MNLKGYQLNMTMHGEVLMRHTVTGNAFVKLGVAVDSECELHALD